MFSSNLSIEREKILFDALLMSNRSKKFPLGETKPRERAGEQTGRKYEFQYEQTAFAALEMMEVQEKTCVYCDWHDDFVVQVDANSTTCFHFHQVKASEAGLWTFRRLFGVSIPEDAVGKASKKSAKKTSKKMSKVKSRAAKVDVKSVVPRMLGHFLQFDSACGGIVFVTNTGLDSETKKFVNTIQAAKNKTELDENTSAILIHLAAAYLAMPEPLGADEDEIFRKLQSIVFLLNQGNLSNVDTAYLIIGDKISTLSEVQLFTTQARIIAREVVNIVRRKAQFTGTIVPVDEQTLSRDKGVVVTDILEVISLSPEGYRLLIAGGFGKDSVRTLSRLQRYCDRHGLKDALNHICKFKSQWDAWRMRERHFMDSIDYCALEKRARDLVGAKFPLEKLVEAAKEIASSINALVPAIEELKADHVMGLIFSLASEAEANSWSAT